MNFVKNLGFIMKNFLGEKSFLFWIVIYPFLFVSMMYAGLSSFLQDEVKVPTVSVAIVGDQAVKQLFDSSDLFQVTVTQTKGEAQTLLEEGTVDGVITPDATLMVSQTSGIPQMVLKEALTQWDQIAALGDAAPHVDFQTDVLQETKSAQSSATAVFYAVLTSLCFYSAFSGVVVVSLLNGSTSLVGRRIGISPYSKWGLLGQCFLATVAIHMVIDGLLVVFVTRVLKIDLLTNVPTSLALLLMVIVTGIGVGLVIGNISYLTQNWKIVLVLILNLVLSAAAGMMNYGLRRAVNLAIPFFNDWSPMAIVSSALYRINVLGDVSSAVPLMGILFGYAAVAFVVAFLLLRRNRFASLSV